MEGRRVFHGNDADLIGQVFTEDIIDDYGGVVVTAGTLITHHTLEKLRQHPISRFPARISREFNQCLEDVVRELNDVFALAGQENRVQLSRVESEIVPRVTTMTNHPDLRELLHGLWAQDNYTGAHSVAVSVLATLIGKWLNLSSDELNELSVAAVLHDIGKAKIPAALLDKKGPLTSAEYRLMQSHTLEGYNLLQRTPGATKEYALTALRHHERMDGSGYPNGISGEQLGLFERIVSISDVFHATTSTRSYHPPRPLYQTLNEIRDGMFGKLDASISHLFLDKMMTGLIGNNVGLSDGRKAKIVMISPTDPTLPLVQTDEGFIDLSVDRSINIVSVL